MNDRDAAVIESAVFSNAAGRWLYVPVVPPCARCGNRYAGNASQGSEAAPRFSEMAGCVLILCGRCSY